MKIIIRTYNRKNKLKARRIGNRNKWAKMYGKLRQVVAKNDIFRIVVRVEYGKKENVYGEKELFWNEYDGNSLKEAKKALSAFIEL